MVNTYEGLKAKLLEEILGNYNPELKDPLLREVKHQEEVLWPQYVNAGSVYNIRIGENLPPSIKALICVGDALVSIDAYFVRKTEPLPPHHGGRDNELKRPQLGPYPRY